MGKKKLIEVALPLEKINFEAEREKQIRHSHPSNIHQYWARRPFTTARAIIWASLVDDPSSHPGCFPTEEMQTAERLRLFKILEQLVEWENSNDENVLSAARAEIMKSTNGVPPALLDPFAGGGAIPMEAQRLGLKAYAHDLNPVAVMINKAMIEIPAKFSNSPPVNPDVNPLLTGCWKGLSGFSEDVRYYGRWVRDEAEKLIGSLYPKVTLPKSKGSHQATVISWIWARTVKCPNPLCSREMPLVKTFDLCTKKGCYHSVLPIVDGNRIVYKIQPQKAEIEGTVSRSGGKCPFCNSHVDFNYIRGEGTAGRMGARMIAIVAEAPKGRIYLEPTVEHELAAIVERPQEYPDAEMAHNPRNFNTPNYGIDHFAELYTNRQMTALTTFSKLIKKAEHKAEEDAIQRGKKNDHLELRNGGSGAKAYAQAIGVHLAFLLDKMTCLHSNITMWKPLAQCPLSFFGRQAIPMAWDYAEANPFSSSSGSFEVMLDGYIKALSSAFEMGDCLPGEAKQHNAQEDCGLRNVVVSTDPPYYDNINYADLSDYFYVWMRYSLKDTYPELFRTMMVPKAEELVATPYRFNGDARLAKTFFEDGMLQTCRQIYKYANNDIPVTIYYAYKQNDIDAGDTAISSGWETMLSAIINSGFSITGTWPVRTERAARNVSIGTNALASSIVLVCRKRSEDAPQTTRRNLINILRRELRPALKKLQDSNIAPVDLAQSAIGPGMGVFSRYRRVLEADGSVMTVRSALQVINEEVDLYFNDQVGSMDAASRFCVDLYTQCAYNNIKYGEAEILANAKSTSIPMMASHGVLYAKAGVVHLLERADLPERVDINESNIWLLTQQLTHAMTKGGVEACAKHVADIFGSNAESAKDLAYRLYTIAERKGWTEEAYAYNALVVAWPDIQSRAADLKALTPEQMTLF